MKLNIHNIQPLSRVNGPGVYFTIWFQGCSLDCPGCFNPDTFSPEPHTLVGVDGLIAQIREHRDRIDGVAISGGEPFQQAEGLFTLVEAIKDNIDLPVLLFSGYTLEEIKRMPVGSRVLGCIDALVCGRYVEEQRVGHALLGSSNQEMHFFSKRLQVADFRDIPESEMVIDSRGDIIISGIQPPL